MDNYTRTIKSLAYGIWKFGETKTGLIANISGTNDKWNQKMKPLIDKGITGYTRSWKTKGDEVLVTLYSDNNVVESIVVQVDKD